MFLKEIWDNRRKINLMSVVDFKSSFKASVLSWFWVLINPALTIAMYLFAFFANDSDAAKTINMPEYDAGAFYFTGSGGPGSFEINRIGWLIIGVLSWGYISSMMSAGAGSIRTYNWMVTKVGTPISVPPALVCVSRSIIGIPLILLSWIIFMIIQGATGKDFIVDEHIIQLPLMILLSFALMLMWSIFISPYASISKDVNNLLSILPVFLQWISGLFLPLAIENMNEPIGIIFRINPFNFLLDGIRSSMTGTSWFWNDGIAFISFFTCFGILTLLAFVSSRKKIKKIVVDLI